MKKFKMFSTFMAFAIFFNSFLPVIATSAYAKELLESNDIELTTRVTSQPLLGDKGNFELTLKNTDSERIYNVGFKLLLPTGVSFGKSIQPINNSIENIFNPTFTSTSIVKWENLTDLLPNESVTIHFELKFNGEPTFYINDTVSFIVSGNGSYSPIFVDQVIEEKEIFAKIQGLSVKTNSDSFVKEILVGESADREITIKNNPDRGTNSDENVEITETLHDGIEYEWNSEKLINNIFENYNYEFRSEEQADGKTFLQWIIDALSTENFKDPIKIKYKLSLPYSKDSGSSVNENEELTVDTNVQAYYEARQHSTELIDLSKSDIVKAKYISVNKVSDKKIVNPGTIINYSIKIQTSKFYDYENLIITDILPDGIEFISSNVNPEILSPNTDGTTSIAWAINTLNADESLTINYKAKVLETYHNNSEILSNDKFSNNVEVKGNWESTEDEQFGESSEGEIEIVQTPRVTTNTTVWKDITNEWVSTTKTNRGYLVQLKIETYVPEKVPTENLNLKLFYPKYLELFTDTYTLEIQNGTTSSQNITLINENIDYINVDLGNASPNTTITLIIEGIISDSEDLVNNTTLRTLTRVTYTNHTGHKRLEIGQGTFLIQNPKGTIQINEGSKYTTTDLISKLVKIEVPDSSLENYVKYSYRDIVSGYTTESDWLNWDMTGGLSQTYPDYLINGSVDGEKEICVEVKDSKDNISKKNCDSITLDTSAPVGTIQINDDWEETNIQIVSLMINQDEDNTDNPVFYSYSVDGVNWSEYSVILNEEIQIDEVDLKVSSGIAKVFVKFKDEAGNESAIFDDTIIVKNNSGSNQDLEKIYGAEYIDVSDRIGNSPTIFSLNNFPDEYYTNENLTLSFDIQNTSNFVWYRSGNTPVKLSYRWVNSDNQTVSNWNDLNEIPYTLEPSQIGRDINIQVTTPDIPGNYILQLDVLEDGITWFNEVGINTYDIYIKITNLNDFENPQVLGDKFLQTYDIFQTFDKNINVQWELLVPVYRFWSPTLQSHFYTINENERNYLINENPDWNFESVAFYVYMNQVAETKPVYRFWSPVLQSHFYTISEAEKNMVLQTWPDVWLFEGIAYYTYDVGGISNTNPVHRFWSSQLASHFYTISEAEKNMVLQTWPDVWKLERSQFHAVSKEKYSQYRIAIETLYQVRQGIYNLSNITQYCGVTKVEAHYKNSNEFYGDMYFNPSINAIVFITHNEYYRDAFYNDIPGYAECDLLGLPTMKTPSGAATSPYGTTGTYQSYDRGGIYHNDKYDSTWSVYGEIYKIYEQQVSSNGQVGTRSSYGFPIGSQKVNSSGYIYQQFEGGVIQGGFVCASNEYWNGSKCIFDEVSAHKQLINHQKHTLFKNFSYIQPFTKDTCLGKNVVYEIYDSVETNRGVIYGKTMIISDGSRVNYITGKVLERYECEKYGMPTSFPQVNAKPKHYSGKMDWQPFEKGTIIYSYEGDFGLRNQYTNVSYQAINEVYKKSNFELKDYSYVDGFLGLPIGPDHHFGEISLDGETYLANIHGQQFQGGYIVWENDSGQYVRILNEKGSDKMRDTLSGSSSIIDYAQAFGEGIVKGVGGALKSIDTFLDIAAHIIPLLFPGAGIFKAIALGYELVTGIVGIVQLITESLEDIKEIFTKGTIEIVRFAGLLIGSIGVAAVVTGGISKAITKVKSLINTTTDISKSISKLNVPDATRNVVKEIAKEGPESSTNLAKHLTTRLNGADNNLVNKVTEVFGNKTLRDNLTGDISKLSNSELDELLDAVKQGNKIDVDKYFNELNRLIKKGFNPKDVGIKYLGENNWVSPAGVKYFGKGSDSLTRIEHVLLHTINMQDKGTHGVFTLEKNEAIFELADNMYKKVKNNEITPITQGSREIYEFNYGYQLGYEGGSSGDRSSLSSVRLVMENDKLISFYPIK